MQMQMPHVTSAAGHAGQNITVEQLIAKIKLSNNGYLFAPSGAAIKIASENPNLFIVTTNRVTIGGTTIRLK